MSKGTFGVGMLIGAVTGYVAATFLAPKPGEETRKEWKQKAEEYAEKAKEQRMELKEKGMELKNKVTSSDEGSDSDDLTVYGTGEGLVESDALDYGQEYSTGVGISTEGGAATVETAGSAGMKDTIEEDVRYREPDILNDDSNV